MKKELPPEVRKLLGAGSVVGIVGSRDWVDRKVIFDFVGGLYVGTMVVSGDCRGVDRFVREAAAFFKMGFEGLPANWGKYGVGGGPVRNDVLVRFGLDVLVVFIKSNSVYGDGSSDVMRRACKFGVPVVIFNEKGLVSWRVQLSLF